MARHAVHRLLSVSPSALSNGPRRLLDGNNSTLNGTWAPPQSPDRVCSSFPLGEDLSGMPKTIRVALVNDYEIVLEGLRTLLRPYDPRSASSSSTSKRARSVTLT